MLDQIRRFLESPDRDDDPFVHLQSIAFDDRDAATLVLRVLNYYGTRTWSVWEVRATGLRDFRVREPHGDLSIHADHVLARQHTDSRVDLSFRVRPRSAAEVAGQLYLTHQRLVSGWIPFDRFLNDKVDLERLLDCGSGKLADGPSFLVEAYAAVLESNDVSPSLLPPRPAKWYDGSRWVETEAQLNTLILGDSYFVAVAFRERMLENRMG